MALKLQTIEHVRPAFWPWFAGQKIGISSVDMRWSEMLSEAHVLHAWWLLSDDIQQPWSVAPLLAYLGAADMTEPLPANLLRTLAALRLAAWDADRQVWQRCCPSWWRGPHVG